MSPTTGIRIILTAANMGDATEADYDAWHSYVVDHIEEETGLVISEVDQHRFTGGPAEDTITGATGEERETIRRWLAVDGWEAFCSAEAESANDAEVQRGAPEGWAY